MAPHDRLRLRTIRSSITSMPGRIRHCGYTLIELLIIVLIIAVLMATGATLLTAAGHAYDDLTWQPRVNQEAQQALDDICETLRYAGPGAAADLLSRIRSKSIDGYQIPPPSAGSPPSTLKFANINGTVVTYQVQQSPTTGDSYLTRQYQFSETDSVGQFIDTVSFEYEYRNVAQSTDTAWNLVRTTSLANWSGATTDPAYLIDVVYVTVTARVQPYPDRPAYYRILRSAVHLRAPYNTTVPPAVAGP